jgi:hypothetical protein
LILGLGAFCRIANQLVPFYNQHKMTNSEIVGISLDTDKTKWMNAIQKTN